MGLFRDDTDYTFRQSGFARYKQLMSFYGFHWLRLNMLAFAGKGTYSFDGEKTDSAGANARARHVYRKGWEVA